MKTIDEILGIYHDERHDAADVRVKGEITNLIRSIIGPHPTLCLHPEVHRGIRHRQIERARRMGFDI